MGGCVSTPADEREAKMRSSVIDKELRAAAREYENTIKILLLGKCRIIIPCFVPVVRVCVCVQVAFEQPLVRPTVNCP